MTVENLGPLAPRTCLLKPIPEIFDAARYLDAAVSAHLSGRSGLAGALIRLADIPAIAGWTNSIWGKNSPHVQHRAMADERPILPKHMRRMPTKDEKRELHRRDGYHCRFCGIPVIRREVRVRIAKCYPLALRWGKLNVDQHAAFQAMWVQYDHLLPHARGGDSGLRNVIITCAPCNYGRMSYTLGEVGLTNPLERGLTQSTWDGLERFQ